MNVDEIVSTITDRVRDTANVKIVFGDPVQYGGVTVIPVAKVKVGGGGGGGTGSKRRKDETLPETKEGKDVGVGMGLSITTTPLGYIEVKNGEARFVNIVDATKIMVGGLIAASLALLAYGKKMRMKKMMKYKHFKHHKYDHQEA